MSSFIYITNDNSVAMAYGIHSMSGLVVAQGDIAAKQQANIDHIPAGTYTCIFSQDGQTRTMVITIQQGSGKYLWASDIFGPRFFSYTVQDNLAEEDLRQYLAEGGEKEDSAETYYNALVKKGTVKVTFKAATKKA